MTNHLHPPHTSPAHTSPAHTSPVTTVHPAPAAPARPVVPAAWAAPTVATAPFAAPTVASRHSTDRRRGWLAAGLGIIAVSVVGTVASVAAVGGANASPRVLTASSADDTAAADTTAPDTTAPDTTTPETTAAPVGTDAAPSDEPLVVLPTDTAPPETTTPLVAHSLATVAVGDCLLDGAFSGCDRGADVVTHVATDATSCNAGETTVTVTESNAVPATVIVCTVPAHVDDRTLAQAFTLDETCAPATADETLALEVEALVCTGDSGFEYLLVKVAEGQMVTYLTEVLGAEFVGDFATTEGNVCGGHYRIDGWDAFVFGYGPFVEFRQAGDTDGVRFSRSLCAA